MSRSSGSADVLIAGCGDLGTRAGKLLASAGGGRTVWGLRRSAADLPFPLRSLRGNLADPESLAEPLGRMDELDAIVYAVAADGFDDDAYRRAYVDGVRGLFAALDKAELRPRRLVYVSSTSVYAQTDGSVVDEESPAEPAGFSGQRLLEGEKTVLEGPIPEAVVLRLGGIYGPGRTRLVDSVRDGRAVCYDDPPIWTNRIHVDDGARAVAHLVDLEDPRPVYLGVDDEPSRDGDVKRRLAQMLGVEAPPRAEEAPSATSRRMRSNKRCSNARLRASGFLFDYPTFREGYRSVLDGDIDGDIDGDS